MSEEVAVAKHRVTTEIRVNPETGRVNPTRPRVGDLNVNLPQTSDETHKSEEP